jgi:hypothetical protein
MRAPCEHTRDDTRHFKANLNPHGKGDSGGNRCYWAGSGLMTPVCCSITSDTRISYGSLVWRHGRSRPFSWNQAKSCCFTWPRLDEPPGVKTASCEQRANRCLGFGDASPPDPGRFSGQTFATRRLYSIGLVALAVFALALVPAGRASGVHARRPTASQAPVRVAAHPGVRRHCAVRGDRDHVLTDHGCRCRRLVAGQVPTCGTRARVARAHRARPPARLRPEVPRSLSAHAPGSTRSEPLADLFCSRASNDLGDPAARCSCERLVFE